MTDETQTIRGEIGTSGDFAEVDITGDSGADIASAIVLEHHCDSASCDIARAVADGYPFWAASLLQNATETPLLDAVITRYCAAGLDFAAMAERDREQWLASETWTQHAHKCGSCGAVTFGDDYWAPTQCDDCGAELTTDRDEIIRTARELDAATMDAETCAAGPGRYEGASDLELLVACDIVAMHGFADATAGSVEYGRYGARIGRYVVWEDDRGFESLETFETASGAQDALDAEDIAQEDSETEF